MKKRISVIVLLIALVIGGTVVLAAPPIANNDTYSTPYQTTLIVGRADGVLSNDSDPDNDPLRAVIVTTPQNSSTFSLAADGSFTYAPKSGFIGIDTFVYAVDDGNSPEPFPEATVTIRVNPIARSDLYETDYQTALSVASPGVLFNDSPSMHPSMQAILFAAPAFGSVAMSPNGAFTYTPRAGFSGIDTFSYQAQIGGNVSPAAIVTISVKQNPQATANNDTYTTNFGTTLIVSAENGVLANDTDPDDDPLTAKLVDNVQHGSLTLQSNGAFTYIPQTNFYGTDTFTYVANDGTSDSNQATVTINVLSPKPRNLSIVGNLLEGIIRPTFLWQAPVDANGATVPVAWYNLIIAHQGKTIFDEWFDATTVCQGINCSIKLTPELSIAGLTNGIHQWTVRGWNNNIFSTFADVSSFSVNVPLPQTPDGFTVTTDLGRPVIGFPHDPNTAWVHVYIGTESGQLVDFDWYHVEELNNTKPITCTETGCELIPNANPMTGNYVAWIQVWGPGGYNEDDASRWSGPRNFQLDFPPPGLITTFTGTANLETATFTWQAAPGLSWYNIWVGTEAPAYQQAYFEWHRAHDLGCKTGVCTLQLALDLSTSQTYTWFVKGWGPAGFTTGGEFDGWSKGNSFNVTSE